MALLHSLGVTYMVLRVVIHLRGYVRRDDESMFVSYCPPLNQWSQGESALDGTLMNASGEPFDFDVALELDDDVGDPDSRSDAVEHRSRTRVFQRVLEADGYRVLAEDELNWVMAKNVDDIPIILPKLGELVAVDVMMGALDRAQCAWERPFD